MGESKYGDVHGTGGIRRRIEHYLAQHPAPRGHGPASKRPYLDSLGLIEKYSPSSPSIGAFSLSDSSLYTTNNTGEDHGSKSSRCASSILVVVDPYSPLVQPLSTWTPKSIMLETTSDARIDREDIPNAHNLPLSSPSSVTAVCYSGSQSVPGLSLLILNHAKKYPSPTASPEFLSFSSVPLPLMSSIKATFLKGLSAFAAMFPSISPSCQIKSSDAGHLCAPDYRFDVDPINSDGCYIRVEFENPLSQHFVEYYFPAPSQTNICDTHFQCGSLVTMDPVGYQTSSHELDKLSQFAIPGDEHNGALPMSPEDLKTMKVVDVPIIVPCKTKEHRSAPLPTTVDDIQEQPATDKGDIGLGPGLLKQNKIQEIGDRADHIQGHQSGPDQVRREPANRGIRKAVPRRRHLDTLATTGPDVINFPPPRQCRLKRRWPNRQKHPKFKSCLAASSHFCSPYSLRLPGQPMMSYSADNEEPGGFGDPFDFSLHLPGFGGFPNNSGLTHGDEIWSGQGPGLELQQRLEMNELLYDPVDSTEPAPNMLAHQPQYYDEGNLPVQQPFRAPFPPVPLQVNLQPDARGSGWSAIEPAITIAAPQVWYYDESGSVSQPLSNTSLPVNSQLDTRGPEWYDGSETGFFDDCNFASGTSRGLPSGTRLQPNSTGHSIVVPTSVAFNVNFEALSTAVDLDFPTAPPLTPRASQGLAVHTIGHQPQAQSSLSTTQITAERDILNGVQIGATSRESASRANNGASTSSHIGPTGAKLNRNIYACEIKGCGRKFPQKERLNNHTQREHLHQPNLYICTFLDCGISLASQDNLNRHRKTVHNVNRHRKTV
ncbi:C2H2-type zinc-finger protein, partial [Rhizoctonia solani 123E]